MSELLVLSQADLAALMRFGDYVEAVADGFRLHREIGCAAPLPMQIAANSGAFHVKAASLPRGSGYVAVKINANFPENPRRRGLPTIQGAVLLSDATDGTPLALLDSGEITMQRRPALMARAKVVADIAAQCAAMGDLHHAIRAGAMRAGDIHGELGELIAGRKRGRENADEITIFDGTGIGIQDVAASARAYEKARERGVGLRCRLA